MLLKQKNVFLKKWRKTQNSLPGINTTARCANLPNLMFPLLRRFALFYLMIFNNISKDSFETFKTNLKTGGRCVHLSPSSSLSSPTGMLK